VAACVAGDLADRLGTPLTLADAAGGYSAHHAARARELVNSLLERPPPVEPRTIPPSRDPTGALAAVARASCAELVALRSSDEPVREPAPGAVARRVGLPVLVVPPVAHVGPDSGHYEMRAA
jgi:hypothetical protein